MGTLHVKKHPVISNFTMMKLKFKKYLKDTAHNILPAKWLKIQSQTEIPIS